MTRKDHAPQPLPDIDFTNLSKHEILSLDTQLVREKLATLPVVAAAKEYALGFANTYSGFTELQNDPQFAACFDVFIAKLGDVIHTVCIEHASPNNIVQVHTEGMTAEKLTEFHAWLDTQKLQPQTREKLNQIVTELIRLTSEFISKYNTPGSQPPTKITEKDFLVIYEPLPELKAYFEELKLFLSQIEYAIPVEELLELYCEYTGESEVELLAKLQEIEDEEGTLDFESIFDLFGQLLF